MRRFYDKYRKICIGFLITIGIFLGYTLFGFFGVPWVLKSVVPSFLADKNATLTIQQAKFHPYKFELNATGVSLATYAQLFSAEQIDAQLKFSELFSKNINIKILRLKEPYLNIQREMDRSFNFDTLATADEASDADESDDSESFFNITLDKFELINGDMRYADASLKRPFEIKLKDLSYAISGVNLKEHSVGKHILGANSNLLDEFDWRGGVSLSPLKIYGDIRFSGLNVGQIWQSYMSDTDFNITQGKLDTRLNYGLSIDTSGVKLDINNTEILAKNFLARDGNASFYFDDLGAKNINLSSKFANKNTISVWLDEILLNGFKQDEIVLKNASLKRLNFNLERDDKTSLVATLAGAKFHSFEQNSSAFLARLDSVELGELKYSSDTQLKASLSDINASNFTLLSGKDEVRVQSAYVSDATAGFDLEKGDFALAVVGVGIGASEFLNAQMKVKNSEFGIKNLDTNASESFKNIDIVAKNLSLNKPIFDGFGFGILSDKIEFNGFNTRVLDSASKILSTIDTAKIAPIMLSTHGEKFIGIDGVDASKFSFEPEKIGLAELKIGKTELFSQGKIFAGLKDVVVTKSEFGLKNNALDIKNISINSPHFTDEIDENGAKAVNNLAILKQDKSEKSEPKKVDQNGKKDADFIANIANIELLNTHARVTQKFLPEILTHDIDLKTAKILDFSTDFTKPFGLNLSAKTSEQIELDLNGKVAIEPLNAKLDVKINARDLSKLNQIVKNYTNAKISSGNAIINAKIELDKNYKVGGNLNLKEFGLDDDNLTRVAGVKELNIKQFGLKQNGLRIENLAIDEPFLKAHIFKDKSLNLSRLIKQNDENLSQNVQSKPKKQSNDEFKIALNDVLLNNASVDFSDDSLVLPFVFGIKNLNAKIDKIQSGSPSQVSMQGTIGTGASANIDIQSDVFDPKKFSQISLKFKDIELNEITPYSATFVGRKIDSGLLDLSLVYDIKDHKMQGKNDVRIDTIRLGDDVASADAMSLPLQLAISILQDSNNVINLNLPVSGDLDNPEFSYGGIVWQAITQLFTDVVTSPFRLMGSILGISGGEEMSSVDFTAGSSDLMQSQHNKIAKLKSITDSKKDLIFIIQPAYDEHVDKFAIQKQIFDRNVAMIANERGVSEFDVTQSIIAQKFKTKPQDPYKQLVEMTEISASTLDDLAVKRAQNLYQALIKAGVPQEQLQIGKNIQKNKANMEIYVPLNLGIEMKK